MRYVIIGASAAGLAAAEVLRRRVPKSSITLISDEPHLPYSRSVSAAIHSPVAAVPHFNSGSQAGLEGQKKRASALHPRPSPQ